MHIRTGFKFLWQVVISHGLFFIRRFNLQLLLYMHMYVCMYALSVCTYVVYKYDGVVWYCGLQHNWDRRNGFQQFHGSKLVLKPLETVRPVWVILQAAVRPLFYTVNQSLVYAYAFFVCMHAYMYICTVCVYIRMMYKFTMLQFWMPSYLYGDTFSFCYVHLYIYIYIYIYIYVFTYMFVCIHVWCTELYVCVCLCLHMYDVHTYDVDIPSSMVLSIVYANMYMYVYAINFSQTRYEISMSKSTYKVPYTHVYMCMDINAHTSAFKE
jgi:hypothetical protein